MAQLYHYYSIYKQKGITLQHNGDFTLPKVHFVQTSIVSPKHIISIIIPYHNSPSLEKLVSSIVRTTDKSYHSKLQLIIVCSACTDTYKSMAHNIKAKYDKNTSLNIIVIEENVPGKPRALNIGLRYAVSEIIIQLTDDIVLFGKLIESLYLALSINKDFGASVAVGFPSNIGNNSLLSKVQSIHNSHTQPYEQHSLMGRAFAFRRSLIPNGFIEHIMAEDYWLSLQAKKRTEGFLIIENSYYIYKKPENWGDYLKQIDRFDGAYKQLRSEFSNLFTKHVKQSPKIKNRFLNMLIIDSAQATPKSIVLQYIKTKEHDLLPKIIYIFIIIYRLYFLKIKNFIFPVSNSFFSREESTL